MGMMLAIIPCCLCTRHSLRDDQGSTMQSLAQLEVASHKLELPLFPFKAEEAIYMGALPP